MRNDSTRCVDAAVLRDAGRQPVTPFSVELANGDEVLVRLLLRVLPGKRIVGVGDWRGQHVLAKFFVASGSERHWAQEKTGLDALRQNGVLTPDMLLAEPLPRGGHVLLTAYLDGAQSLAERWATASILPAGDAQALEVLCPAFRMLGAVHAAGLVHDDVHLGNFLYSEQRIFLIDGDAVHAITPGTPLDALRAINNLALLLAQLPMGWDVQRSRLLEAYYAGGGCPITDTALLERSLSRVRTWRLNDFLGKTIRDCTLFAVRRSAFRFVAVQRGQAKLLTPLLDSPDTAIHHGIVLKDGRTCTVARVEQDGRSLVIKRYNLKNFQHALERFWRPTRAWHAWREGHLLRFLGIATPEPLALIEERIGPLRRRAFLINEFCPGPNLLKVLSPDREPDDELGSEILSLFRSLHGLCISHGDLKATNLLWHGGHVFLIDLDALEQHLSASSYARAWQVDRARFLRNWPSTSVLHQWLDMNLPAA